MQMGILKAGGNEAAMQVNDGRVGNGKLLDLGIRAHRDDLVATHRQGFGRGMRVVACPDLSIEEDAVNVIGGERG